MFLLQLFQIKSIVLARHYIAFTLKPPQETLSKAHTARNVSTTKDNRHFLNFFCKQII